MLFLATAAHAKTSTLAEYITALEHIHSLLSTHQLTLAKSEAIALLGSQIDVTFHADDSLLNAIAQARGADPALLTRIELTLAELRNSEPAGNAPDEKLLQKVAAEQNVPELAPGGEVASPIVSETPLMERIANNLLEMLRWIGKKVSQFIDWLLDFLPKRRVENPGATSGLRWIVFAVVALIVIALILLAIDSARRRRHGDADLLTSTAPLRSTRDDDPLSRGATEWERYAMQLANDSRFREAIRAWYHAVLVTCYSAGALHFRKGRTNWEYIASLAPSVAWRPELIRLTQSFEQQWYGSMQSTRDACDECRANARQILDELHASERGAA
jgi:hypothetical protein